MYTVCFITKFPFCWRLAQATSRVLSVSGARLCVWETERGRQLEGNRLD